MEGHAATFVAGRGGADVIDTFLTAAMVVLVINVVVASVRILRGPGPRDRIAGMLLISTSGAATLALLAHVMDERSLRDAALAIVALAALLVLVRITSERAAS